MPANQGDSRTADKRRVRRFMIGESTCKDGARCLEEHKASRTARDGGGLLKNQLIAKLGTRSYGALLDQLNKTTAAKRQPRRKRAV